MKKTIVLILLAITLLVCGLRYYRLHSADEKRTAGQNERPVQSVESERREPTSNSATKMQPEVEQITSTPSSDDKQRMLSVMRLRSTANVVSSKQLVDAFLEKWSPIGWTTAELQSVFGKPDTEAGDILTYHFDTGFGGWAFNFEVQSGKVSAVKCVGVD